MFSEADGSHTLFIQTDSQDGWLVVRAGGGEGAAERRKKERGPDAESVLFLRPAAALPLGSAKHH